MPNTWPVFKLIRNIRVSVSCSYRFDTYQPVWYSILFFGKRRYPVRWVHAPVSPKIFSLGKATSFFPRLGEILSLSKIEFNLELEILIPFPAQNLHWFLPSCETPLESVDVELILLLPLLTIVLYLLHVVDQKENSLNLSSVHLLELWIRAMDSKNHHHLSKNSLT